MKSISEMADGARRSGKRGRGRKKKGEGEEGVRKEQTSGSMKNRRDIYGEI